MQVQTKANQGSVPAPSLEQGPSVLLKRAPAELLP